MAGPYPYWGAGKIVDHVDKYLFDETLVLVGEDGAPFFDPLRDVSFVVSERIWVNNHIHVLRPLTGIDADYLCHALNAVDYADFITGSTRDKLTQEQLGAIALPLPPIEVQSMAARDISATNREIENARDELARSVGLLVELKRSLITAAVTGQFDVGSAHGSRVSA
jgi:type I restriction enzyme, S subunit